MFVRPEEELTRNFMKADNQETFKEFYEFF